MKTFDNIFNNNDMLKLQEYLISNNKTITTAESCTGGLIASYITSNSGSSAIFRGSIIAYCNDIKEQELNVSKSIMIKYGVVSKEVVLEMLKGAIIKFDADYAIAISGIAGPTGGTKTKPVGTVVIGVMDSNDTYDIEIYHFQGSRNEIQMCATKTALNKIAKFINLAIDK